MPGVTLGDETLEEPCWRCCAIAVSAEITGTMVVCIDAGKAPTKGNERIDRSSSGPFL